ncbi:MAG: hypothetical protein V3S64_15815 [bacterium]
MSLSEKGVNRNENQENRLFDSLDETPLGFFLPVYLSRAFPIKLEKTGFYILKVLGMNPVEQTASNHIRELHKFLAIPNNYLVPHPPKTLFKIKGLRRDREEPAHIREK